MIQLPEDDFKGEGFVIIGFMCLILAAIFGLCLILI